MENLKIAKREKFKREFFFRTSNKKIYITIYFLIARRALIFTRLNRLVYTPAGYLIKNLTKNNL